MKWEERKEGDWAASWDGEDWSLGPWTGTWETGTGRRSTKVQWTGSSTKLLSNARGGGWMCGGVPGAKEGEGEWESYLGTYSVR